MPPSPSEMVREKLDAGMLPRADPPKLWMSAGSGKPCAACDRPILATQAEYEPHYDDGLTLVRLHKGCHGLWEAERHRFHQNHGVR